MLLLAFEVLARDFIREGQPARGVDVGRFEDRVDLVLGLQALGDNLELQDADGAEQQVAGRQVFEDLDRAFFAEFLQALLQLLAFQRIAQAGDAEEFRREVGDALEESVSPSVSVSPMCSWPWLWMPMMSPATASSISTRSLAMKVSALASFISRSMRTCFTFMPGCSGRSRRGRRRCGRGASGPCWPGS